MKDFDWRVNPFKQQNMTAKRERERERERERDSDKLFNIWLSNSKCREWTSCLSA